MTQENQSQSSDQQGQENQNTNANTEKGDDKGGKEFKAITSQDEFDRAIKDRLDRQKDSHKSEMDGLQKQIDDLKAAKNTDSSSESGDKKKSPLEKQIEEMQKKFDELAADKKATEDAEARGAAVKAEKLDAEWAELIAGKDAAEWDANAKKVRELINKNRKAPDTDTGNRSAKGPRGQQSNGTPEFKYRARGKQVSLT